jgi:hypothetical protein
MLQPRKRSLSFEKRPLLVHNERRQITSHSSSQQQRNTAARWSTFTANSYWHVTHTKKVVSGILVHEEQRFKVAVLERAKNWLYFEQFD